MTKDYAIKRLETILNHNSSANGYNYRIKVNNWENYGKSRTYFSIIETRDNSKHYAEKRYGYIDNKTGEYIPEKGDLTKNQTFSGSNFEETEVVEEKEIEVSENLTAADVVESVEKVMKAVEEHEKNDEMIDEVKKLHQTILENMKAVSGTQLKEDFGILLRNITGDTRKDYSSLATCIQLAELEGRNYREKEVR